MFRIRAECTNEITAGIEKVKTGRRTTGEKVVLWPATDKGYDGW